MSFTHSGACMKFFVTLTVLSALSFSAVAATTSNLKLRGKVPKKLSILVTPDPIALNLDLEASPTSLLVASVNEKSNSHTGYKITADSQNDGKLVNQGDNSQSVTYSMTYDGSAVNLTSTSVVKNVGASGIYNDNSEVRIAYIGAPHDSRVEGNYIDTVTFTISAN